MPLITTPSPRLRRLAALGLTAALAAGTAAAPAAASGPRAHIATHRACANQNVNAAKAPAQLVRDAVVCLVNQQRSRNGLPKLHESRLLDRSAQHWAHTMIASGDFTHGASFSARISAVGFAWSSAGENIASGYPTPRAVVGAWMASTGHCQNILNPTFTRVGTGVTPHTVGGYSGGATWAQDFALPRGARAPSHNWGPASRC
ncbi:MAG TPA: CAP domain-containing protein [Solirubrobacteraceae bacterium]|jgi:uncharacterized protein YkwD